MYACQHHVRRVVLWLARLRGFRLTAERLRATQAAISSRISALEEELGVKLFERGPREITLTQDGTKAWPFAEQMVQLNRAMVDSVTDRKKIAGLLRLGAIESVVHTWLPELLKRVRDEYPRLTLELMSDTSAYLSSEVTHGHLDAALVSTPIIGEDVGSSPLGRLPMIWVASPNLDVSVDIRDRTPISSICLQLRARIMCRSIASPLRRQSVGS
jgi:DNA-binding transcriptional LysR family regulator